MSKYYFDGELRLSDALLTRMDYQVFNSKKVTSYSVTDVLEKIYDSSIPFIKIKIQQNDYLRLFLCGKLVQSYDKDGILDWFVENENGEQELGSKLYDMTGEVLHIEIDDYLEKEEKDVVGYDRKENKM